MKINCLHRQTLAGCIFSILLLTSVFVENINAQDVKKYPVAEVTAEPTFHGYTYYTGGGYKTIIYFIVKSAGGEIKTAFDACDVCYASYKGFTKVGTDMQCNNCGNKYAIEGLGTENKGGGCWPGYLPRTIEGENVVIQISDIEGGEHYFKWNPGNSGIEQLNNEFAFRISNERLLLSMDSQAEKVISVTGLNGKIYSSVRTASTDVPVNIANLSKGIYILNIIQGDMMQSAKFLVR